MLRMLEGALGAKTFYKALNTYLTGNAYKNADQNTLIDAFEKVQRSGARVLKNAEICLDTRK